MEVIKRRRGFTGRLLRFRDFVITAGLTVVTVERGRSLREIKQAPFVRMFTADRSPLVNIRRKYVPGDRN